MRGGVGDFDSGGGRGEAELGVPVAGPAPSDLGRVSVVWAVSAYAVADPQRRGLGVEEAVSFAPPGSDGHEAVLALQHVGLLQQPVQAFAVAGTTAASMKCRS
jgi:hypothetical protein